MNVCDVYVYMCVCCVRLCTVKRCCYPTCNADYTPPTPTPPHPHTPHLPTHIHSYQKREDTSCLDKITWPITIPGMLEHVCAAYSVHQWTTPRRSIHKYSN